VICLGIDSKGKLAYLFSAGLIADTAAMPLITSNPINIVSADFFKYSFIQHLIFMGPIAVATILSSLMLVYLFFRKKIPKTYNISLAEEYAADKPKISGGLLKISFATLAAIDVGYVLTSLGRVPVSLVICSGALFMIVIYWFSLRGAVSVEGEQKGLVHLAKEINWDIILFMLSIFLVVQGLQNAGVVELLASALVTTSALPSVLGVFVPSLVVTVGASFMNNWPMTILGLLSIKHVASTAFLSAPAFTGLVFSNVIGNNLGPHFFPLGSLAILMWMECMRKRGVNINLKEYLKVGAVVSIAEVAIASLVLWAELSAVLTLSI
jgi:arsenical pump membrane protein